MRKTPKRNIACLNRKCRFYGKKCKKNIIKNGKKKNGRRIYKCTSCDRQFVDTIGTPLYRKKMDKKEIVRICKQFAEKTSFRGVARVTNHKLDTIRNLAESMAEHCRQTTDFFLIEVKLNPIEVDEIWTFVKKNKKNLARTTINSVNRVIRTLTLR